jgi:pimeloyl-ACP methyl ester carboxylesterase
VEISSASARVLLVPGGGWSVHGYFPQLASCLGASARLIAADPPGLDVDNGRRWLRLSDHASWLARLIRLDGGGPVVVVGHSLGGLVSLRLALDEPELVAGLLLLDPSPLMPAALLPAGVLKPFGASRKVAAATLRPLSRRLGRDLRRDRTGAPKEPRSVPTVVRLAWYLLFDGLPLSADLAAGRLAAIPTTVVSADEHTPDSVTRRTHQRLIAWITDARLDVWDDTTHSLHLEEPRIAEAAMTLVSAAADRHGDRS